MGYVTQQNYLGKVNHLEISKTSKFDIPNKLYMHKK